MAEMNKVDLALKVALSLIILLHCCEGTSTTLSPLGMVSVCPGGQVLLTCERISGSFLFWTVSIPRLAMTREVIVPSQGIISTTALQFNGLHLTDFNVTRTSDSTLISQLLINNVTTEINGSTIYCSEDGNENGAPAVAVNVIYIYVTCDLPTQLLNHPVVVVSGSQDSPPIEGQFITYTCPPGFILTGPNASVCTGNREWEPGPGEVDCIADCGIPLVGRNVTLNYSSTLEGAISVLVLTCEGDIPAVSIIKQIITVICHSSGNWIPDPTQFTCSEASLIPPVQTGSGTINLVVVFSSTIVVVSAVCSIVFLFIGYACGWFSQKHKKSCTSKAEDDENNNEGSQHPQTPGPLYEELQQRSTPEHQDLVELKENVAYGPIIK